jgi:phosphoribosyl 1,2-cyclic phosphate phosphodiesterase
MRVTLLGSGGALVAPRPTCRCRVCADARANPEHRRGGPCLYVHDGAILVDAPEDVLPMLGRAGVEQVDHLLLSHWHPDHTAGFRVVEQLSWDLATGGARHTIQVWLNQTTLDKRGDDWAYFQRRGYCQLNVVPDGASWRLGGLVARALAYAEGGYLTGFELADGASRVLLLLDETKGLAPSLPAWACGVDLLVLECGFFERDADGRELVPTHWRMRQTEASFAADTLPLVEAAGARQTVLVHLNGCLVGRTPPELAALSLPRGARFAHDGLVLET